jgi:hypothetical protein
VHRNCILGFVSPWSLNCVNFRMTLAAPCLSTASRLELCRGLPIPARSQFLTFILRSPGSLTGLNMGKQSDFFVAI